MSLYYGVKAAPIKPFLRLISRSSTAIYIDNNTKLTYFNHYYQKFTTIESEKCSYFFRTE